MHEVSLLHPFQGNCLRRTLAIFKKKKREGEVYQLISNFAIITSLSRVCLCDHLKAGNPFYLCVCVVCELWSTLKTRK